MRRIDWILVIVPLLACLFLDQVTKLIAVKIEGIHSFGLVHFVLHQNHGAMLGLFSDLPPLVRVVSLSTGGAFLIGLYALIQFLLPIKSLVLRSGLSFLLGGILGNVFDRVRLGYIIDFIVVGTTERSSPAFNVADAVQWIGYFMMAFALIKEGDVLWPENDTRKKFWVNRKFQLKYCYFLMSVGLILSIIGYFFSYTFLKVTIKELVGENPYLLNRFLVPFTVTYVLISVVFSASLFAIGKIISHRMAGPVYAFEKYINEILTDTAVAERKQLRLRAKDEFQELERLASLVRQWIIKGKPEKTEKIFPDADG
jgi:signal peptidase II